MNSLSKYFPVSKKIPIDKFISNALYNEECGYYSQKIPFGKNGDFITSPNISILFSGVLHFEPLQPCRLLQYLRQRHSKLSHL